MDALLILTHITMILILGLFCSIIAKRYKIPNVLLLVLVGMFLGNLTYYGEKVIQLPELFLTSIGLLALVMIVFDSASRFKLKEFDSFSWKALHLSVVFLVLCIVLLSFAANLFFKINSIYLSLIFAILMAGTDPSAVLAIFKGHENKVSSMLQIESIINTPLVVILPFIVIDINNQLLGGDLFLVSTFIDQILPFLMKFIVGIGTGVFAGIIMLKIMKNNYSKNLSPLAIFISALFTYVLAENLNGSGVLAVTTLGLLFGNTYVKQRVQLQEFSSIISSILQILVFVLVGLIIEIPLTFDFFFRSIAIFAIYIIIRYIALEITFRKKDFSFKEKIFMSLNASKGIAVAVMTFTLSIILQKTMVLNLVLAFLLYSIILSSIMTRFVKYFVTLPNAKK